MDNIGELIKALRKQRGYTQKQLAEKAGISSNSIIKYERGQMSPSIFALGKIGNALDVDILAQYPKYINSDVSVAKAYEKGLLNRHSSMIFCDEFSKYMECQNIDVLTCSDTKLMQLFAAFLGQRHK